MRLNGLDWVVVAVCLLAAFAPAVFFAKRAGKGLSEFFVSGRSAPWWLIGTSMVATTFSTDTPNLVANFVRTDGVSGNWRWWAFLLTGMLTVFFYARLWRRSGVMTDLEFYEIRYSGKAAVAVRAFRSVYLGLIFNCFIMATVTLAAVKICNVMLGWDRGTTILVCAGLCILFSSISGLWGVLAADLVQFCIAMIGVFAAAYYALGHPDVGGLAALIEKTPRETLSFWPDPSNRETFVAILVMPLAVQWWSAWYPGSEPGGGSYVAQRMLAAKDERHAMTATLWFNIAHYALRPWPWIIVALCSLIVFPTLDDLRAIVPGDGELVGHDMAYPAMLTLLPHGLLGLLLASLISAYVSTMSTHLNWGASYLVHDLYQRFIAPDRDERHYVLVSRIATVVLMAGAAGTVYLLSDAKDAFDLLLAIGAGTGLIYLLRWYWWRVNAWSEIAAMVASLATAITLAILKKLDKEVPYEMLWAVGITTSAWIITAFVTPATNRQTLISFCRLIRPAGPGWRDVRREGHIEGTGDSIGSGMLGWLLGCFLVYSSLFAVGSFLYGRIGTGVVLTVIAIVSGAGMIPLMRSIWQTAPAQASETP